MMPSGFIFFREVDRTFHEMFDLAPRVRRFGVYVDYGFDNDNPFLGVSNLIEAVIHRKVLRIDFGPERLIQVDGQETYCLKVQTEDYSFIIPDKEDLASALNELLSFDREWRQKRYIESQPAAPTAKWSLKRWLFSLFSKIRKYSWKIV